MKDFSKLGPPWILFTDEGKPVAILAAGRPGEVANVEGWPIETVSDIIQAANAPIRRSVEEAMAVLTTKMEAMGCIMPVEEEEEEPVAAPCTGPGDDEDDFAVVRAAVLYNLRELAKDSLFETKEWRALNRIEQRAKAGRAKEEAEVAYLRRPPKDIHESQQLRYFVQVRAQIEKELAEG